MQALECFGCRTAPGRRLAEASGQVLRGLFDPREGDARKFSGALQHLNAGHGSIKRPRKLGLSINSLQPRAHHGDPRSGNRGHRCRCHKLCPSRKSGHPGIRHFHLTAETPEAPAAGFANPFQFCTDLFAANGGKTDRNAFFSH